MAQAQEARVPDIGDYSDVPVIEVLVSVGDTVQKDQGLITLESDKATLEVPAAFGGVVKELKVKVGDTLSEGSVVALIEPAGEGDAPKAEAKPAEAPKAAPSPGAGWSRPGRSAPGKECSACSIPTACCNPSCPPPPLREPESACRSPIVSSSASSS